MLAVDSFMCLALSIPAGYTEVTTVFSRTCYTHGLSIAILHTDEKDAGIKKINMLCLFIQ